MKTDIQAFCNDFEEKIRPFSLSLEGALRALEEKTDFEPLKQTALRLQEVRHRLGSLLEKMAGQQAYLLIFGPLKSGKSTLMNAISGAYVSEVSSLPAYPALVYVKDGQERRYEATSYDGQTRSFRNGEEMSEAVRAGHRALAQRILEVEREGGSFDPAQHHADAIRRMDIVVPAKNLAESGSVLVDTPGLYSRMKFGYDVMTRDFRDTAACAIFVVKTDNLFFEKVFEEFNELLGYFSRIFLVANIDASKKDLNPDGSLGPSLESEDPSQVIKAFQSLSMSAPLREAYEDGRLNVYTIDLLQAASAQLRAANGLEADEGVESGSEGDREGSAEERTEANAAPSTVSSDEFDRFLKDLTEYLNSSDYLHEFMYDSLRFGESLGDEAVQVVGEDALGKLKSSQEQLTERLAQLREKLQSIKAIEQIDWEEAFDHVQVEKERLLHELLENHAEKLGTALNASLERWMESDGSLHSLQDGSLNRHIEEETSDDAAAILPRLRSLFDNSYGGARFGPEQARAFDRVEIKVSDAVPGLLDELGREVEPRVERIVIDQEEIPVRLSFWDRLLFRSQRKVRRKLFGEDGEATISAARKEKRLGGAGLEKLRAIVHAYPESVLPDSHRSYVERLVGVYVERFRDSVNQQMGTLKERLSERQRKLEAQLVAHRQIQSILEELEQSTGQFVHSLEQLRDRYQAEPREAATAEGEVSLEQLQETGVEIEGIMDDTQPVPGDLADEDLPRSEDGGAEAEDHGEQGPESSLR